MKFVPVAIAWIAIAQLVIAPRSGAQIFLDFTLEPVESTGNVGTSASLAVDGLGQPHVAYFDLTNNMLRYAWRDGSGWHSEPVAAADVVRNCSLTLESGGTPVIVYTVGPEVRSATRGASDWSFQNLDSFAPWAVCVTTAKDGSVHAGYLWSTSGGTYEGHISYAYKAALTWVEDHIESSLWYFIPTNPHCSIAVDGDLDPWLCYSNHASRELRCFQRSGGTWSSSLVSYGTWSSIAFDATDVPHVSFYDTESRQLRIAIGSPGHWSVGVVDDTPGVGQYSSLAFGPGDRAHIAYYDSIAGDLEYAHIDPFDAMWTTQTVDSGGDTGRWSSLALDSQGNVHIAYYDATNGDLRYATTRSGVPVRGESWSGVKSMFRGGGKTADRKP